MKKRTKTKKTKKSGPHGNEMPDLVAVMGKFLERIESLEKKTDVLTARVSSLPSELRQIVQGVRPSGSQPVSGQGTRPEQGSREKVLYEAVCADCRKNCKVPFRPSGDRPVYCPECFAIRKAGHAPKDILNIKPPPPKKLEFAPMDPQPEKADKTSKGKKGKKAKPSKRSKK